MAKKQKVYVDTRTPEEKLRDSEAKMKDDISFAFVGTPPASRIFEVGEAVDLGGLKDPVVKHVHFGGSHYTVEYTEQPRHGEPFRAERTFTWRSLYKKNNEITNLWQGDDFRFSPSNSEIGSILHSYYYTFGVDMSPDYQRGYEWELEDKIALIDSIFHGAKIGLFVFNRRDFVDLVTPGYEIVDGKQRLNAIVEFCEDKFPYKGLYWSQIHKGDRNRFESHLVEIAVLHEASMKQILSTFLKINRTGKAISKNHLDKVEGMLKDLKE